MQSIYSPSVVFDQRTIFHNTAEIIKELDRRHGGKQTEIKPSKISQEVTIRIKASKSRGRPRTYAIEA